MSEGVDYSSISPDAIQGTPIAYKLHPIPEQAINGTHAENYTSYYTHQINPGGKVTTQTANWFNNFTIEFVNGTGFAATNVNVSAEMQTVGDVLFKKRYIGAWQPHWTWI